MASIHPKGRTYFQKGLNKLGGNTLEPRTKFEVVTPITQVDPILEGSHIKPQKKIKKRDRSSRCSYSLPRHHRHGVGDSFQPLSKSLYGTSMRFSESVSFNLNGPERLVFQSTTTSSLADATIELSTQCLMISKRLKEVVNGISTIEHENLKKELSKSGKSL